MFKRKTRVSSGLSHLDRLLGGLFIGDNVVWYDDAGSLAAAFSFNFIQESIDGNKDLVYVSFDRSPKTILEDLGPLAKSQHLTILDCFTHGKGDGSEIFSRFYDKDGAQWPFKIIKVKDPSEPAQVSEAIYNVHQSLQGDVRFVFESLTGMQDLWGGEEFVLKFYTRSCPRLYELDTIAYWIMEKGAHSDRLRAHINQIAQVAIDLSVKRGKSSLTILKADKRKPDTLNVPTGFWNEGADILFESEGRIGSIDLGQRVKELRTKIGLPQKDLAGLVGVTPSTISQIESNSIYPSLPALFKIAQSLEVEVASFFQRKPEAARRLVFHGGGKRIQFPDLPKDSISGYRLSPPDFEAKAEPYLLEIPGGQKLAAHFFIHKGEEVGYLLSGQLKMILKNAVYDLTAGDLIYLTADIPAGWENKGEESAQLFWIKIG